MGLEKGMTGTTDYRCDDERTSRRPWLIFGAPVWLLIGNWDLSLLLRKANRLFGEPTLFIQSYWLHQSYSPPPFFFVKAVSISKKYQHHYVTHCWPLLASFAFPTFRSLYFMPRNKKSFECWIDWSELEAFNWNWMKITSSDCPRPAINSQNRFISLSFVYGWSQSTSSWEDFTAFSGFRRYSDDDESTLFIFFLFLSWHSRNTKRVGRPGVVPSGEVAWIKSSCDR
jgi:hypothetical protein